MSRAFTEAQEKLYAELRGIQLLGYPLMPAWGLNADGHCRCPDGNRCTRSAGKHPFRPLVPNGVKNSSVDGEVLRDWVNRGVGCNWCIACGFPCTDGSGYLWCLDVDPRNGGDETLGMLEAKFGKLPETVREVTCNGGYHYFFKSRGPVSCGVIGPGLDRKGLGGYVVSAIGGSVGLVLGSL